MTKFTRLIAMVLVVCSFGMVGCSEQIPPAYVGKILTPNGYEPEVLPPSRPRLWPREKLILVETGTQAFYVPMKIKMADDIELKFSVRYRGRVKATNPAILNAMFNDIVPNAAGVVTLQKVNATYGRMVVDTKSREVMTQYSVDDLSANYKRISSEIYNLVQKYSVGLPMTITDIALVNVDWPNAITEAANSVKAKELAIAQAEAQIEIDLKEKENEIRLIEKQKQIDIKKAEAAKEVNKKLAEGLNPAVMELKRMEMFTEMSKSGSVIYFPMEMTGSVGLANKVMK